MRDVDTEAAAELERALGLLPVTARVLVGRDLRAAAEVEAFLDPGLDQLHSPFEFVQMEAAVERLLAALRRSETIVVHGDYDVDGVTGTVLLVTVLRALGGEVEYIVPHRIDDGYGLRPGGIDRARRLGADVLIAVDCGVGSVDAAERAAELGIDLIIADHHHPGPVVPPAVAVLDPLLPDSGYPEPGLAAVGIAFKLARGLLQRHERGLKGAALLKLVAIGTVADMVPLTGENRVIAHHGLATLREAVNPGLRALMELSGVGSSRVTTGDIGFRIAPRINAAGRLGDAADAVEMFLAGDPGRARRLARRLHETNDRRRVVEREVLEAALSRPPDEGEAVVVAAGEGWHRGVIGIVASRLVEEYGRPAIVLSTEAERAYGSARSIPGFDLVQALGRVADLLTRWGGHRQAAGLELQAGRIDELREALTATSGEAVLQAVERDAVLWCDAALDPHDDLEDLALELDRLAPFGVGNRRPRLLCRGFPLRGDPELLKEEHVKLRVGHERPVEALGWRKARLADELAGAGEVDLVATLKMRRWRGRRRPQLEIVEARPAD